MPGDAAQPIAEITIVLRLRAIDPPAGHIVAGEREFAFSGWVALVSLINQLARERS